MKITTSTIGMMLFNLKKSLDDYGNAIGTKLKDDLTASGFPEIALLLQKNLPCISFFSFAF
jgi:hypothetical protein